MHTVPSKLTPSQENKNPAYLKGNVQHGRIVLVLLPNGVVHRVVQTHRAVPRTDQQELAARRPERHRRDHILGRVIQLDFGPSIVHLGAGLRAAKIGEGTPHTQCFNWAVEVCRFHPDTGTFSIDSVVRRRKEVSRRSINPTHRSSAHKKKHENKANRTEIASEIQKYCYLRLGRSLWHYLNWWLTLLLQWPVWTHRWRFQKYRICNNSKCIVNI